MLTSGGALALLFKAPAFVELESNIGRLNPENDRAATESIFIPVLLIHSTCFLPMSLCCRKTGGSDVCWLGAHDKRELDEHMPFQRQKVCGAATSSMVLHVSNVFGCLSENFSYPSSVTHTSNERPRMPIFL